MNLSRSDRNRLLRIAKVMESEALTWCEGFAVYDPKGEWIWDEAEYGWAHVRAFKLEQGAKFLRELAKKADC